MIKREDSIIDECFQINNKYILNYLTREDKDSLLYASIEVFSLPINIYSINFGEKEYIETEDIIEKKSININLEKGFFDEYPKICFRPSKKNSVIIFMIEVNHISPKLKNNIDIYYPLFSGRLHTKTLPTGTIGIYSHISNYEFIEKISFYLRTLDDAPEMYYFNCEDYPNCISDINITNFNLSKKVEKANNYLLSQYYTKKINQKDLAPNGNNQSLLLVLCPKNEINSICQFQLLVYSDRDEVSIDKNNVFYVSLGNDETVKYQLNVKKNEKNFKFCEFCVNSYNNYIIFNKKEELLIHANATTIEKDSDVYCYQYRFDKRYYSLKKNDIIIHFEIHASQKVNFELTNKVFNKDEIGDIFEINEFALPYELNLEIEDITNINTDLLFNIYLNWENIEDMNILTNNVLIGVILINQTFLNKSEGNNYKDIFNNTSYNTLVQKIDIGTKSSVIKFNLNNFNVELIEEYEPYYLHFLLFQNSTNSTKDNVNNKLSEKLFVIEKENNKLYNPEKNSFISDYITIANQTIINLYNLQTEKLDILELKFSSNYPLNENFSLYFLNYEKNAIIDLNYCQNNSLNYTKRETGQVYLFKLEYIDKCDSIILALVSNIKKEEVDLNQINYIFKYYIYQRFEYNYRPSYDYTNVYDLIEEDDKIILQFKRILQKREYYFPRNEIYIRKIIENNTFINESLDTFAIIETKYELIQGTKKEDNDKINITLKKNKNETIEGIKYSIIYDMFEENEKFVISKLGKKKRIYKDNDDELRRYRERVELLLKIFVPLGIIFIVGLFVLIIYCLRKKREEPKIENDNLDENGDIGLIDTINEVSTTI